MEHKEEEEPKRKEPFFPTRIEPLYENANDPQYPVAIKGKDGNFIRVFLCIESPLSIPVIMLKRNGQRWKCGRCMHMKNQGGTHAVLECAHTEMMRATFKNEPDEKSFSCDEEIIHEDMDQFMKFYVQFVERKTEAYNKLVRTRLGFIHALKDKEGKTATAIFAKGEEIIKYWQEHSKKQVDGQMIGFNELVSHASIKDEEVYQDTLMLCALTKDTFESWVQEFASITSFYLSISSFYGRYAMEPDKCIAFLKQSYEAFNAEYAKKVCLQEDNVLSNVKDALTTLEKKYPKELPAIEELDLESERLSENSGTCDGHVSGRDF
jgi:hypothetical protein